MHISIVSACPPGFSGRNCATRCECKNSAECNSVTGECLCAPGWRGVGCDESKSQKNSM